MRRLVSLLASIAVSDLSPELAVKIVEACGANAEELAGAIGRAFDGEFVVKADEPTPFDESQLAGPGLAVVLVFGERALVVALPYATGMLPEWVKAPDPTGESKLSTLAQELSMLVVPDDLMADDSRCVWVDLPAAVAAAAPADGAMTVLLELVEEEELGSCRILWPVTNPAAIQAQEPEQGAPQASETPSDVAQESAGDGGRRFIQRACHPVERTAASGLPRSSAACGECARRDGAGVGEPRIEAVDV